MNNNIAIYTCITGGYDIPTDGFENKDGYDYFLFSDVPIETKSWKNIILPLNIDNLINVKKQRFVKTHPFEVLNGYDVVVWIDANTDINQKLYDYIESNKDNLITFKKHPARDCIYAEIKECIRLKKETPEIGNSVRDKLKLDKYPEHNGLYETNIIISHPQNDEVKKLFSKWWEEICNFSHRDQLSLNYVIWKNHLEGIIKMVKSSDFKPKVHKKKDKFNMKNIVIVNYNTQNLTNACIKSINKNMNNVKIYVFDNSDKEPFINTHKNVVVLDNTKQQIVNFDEVLEKYNEKTSYGAESNFGTLKHAMSVDKCFDIIGDCFILLDSDVLIKKDISEIYDKQYIFVGDVKVSGLSKKKRLLPHICFINAKKAVEKGIKYFDEKRIVGLTKMGDDYDTGASFYYDSYRFKNKKINENDYIVHYGAGSWINLTSIKKIKQTDWLNLYRNLWDENSLTIYICTHKDFTPKVKNNAYKIVYANKINYDVTKNGLKDDFYSELYQFKFVNDNVSLPKYIGFCHYRRYFGFLDDIPNMDEVFEKCDCIVAKPMELKFTTREHYARCHNIEDLEIVEGIINDKFPNYKEACELFLNGNILVPYNMFIMKREDFKRYCDFVFGVLDEYVKIVGTDINKRIEDNKDKYLKDFYPNNTIEYQYRIGGYLAERLTNIFLMNNFKKMKTYNVIVTENKYSKKG